MHSHHWLLHCVSSPSPAETVASAGCDQQLQLACAAWLRHRGLAAIARPSMKSVGPAEWSPADSANEWCRLDLAPKRPRQARPVRPPLPPRATRGDCWRPGQNGCGSSRCAVRCSSVRPSRAAVAGLVRACRLGVAAAVDTSEHPEAALVGLAALGDGTLILDATRGSRRSRPNIHHDPHVAVVVVWSDDVSLQIEGSARSSPGDRRNTYGHAYLEQFPGSRALDRDVEVIIIRPSWLRSYAATVSEPRIEEARWV